MKFAGRILGIVAVLAAVRPALAQHHIYWGDMHGHTAHSDGKGSRNVATLGRVPYHSGRRTTMIRRNHNRLLMDMWASLE